MFFCSFESATLQLIFIFMYLILITLFPLTHYSTVMIRKYGLR